MDFPLFTRNWSAIDDLLLLKGISQSGIDNWVETAANLGDIGVKTPDMCASHFYSFYYQSKDKPRPDPNEIMIEGRDTKNGYKPIVNKEKGDAN